VFDKASRLRVAIIGSGNIGSDLLAKLARSDTLELVGMAGIDSRSDGLAHAASAGVLTTHAGLAHLLEQCEEIDLAFDATSARAHPEHARQLKERGIRCIDLTPAALGPAVVPSVNLGAHAEAPDVNLITCGAQATVPIVAALSGISRVPYAEIVSTIAARSAGPGTRQNIDEFTQSTATALETVGGADRGKAIVLLNPADPPIVMRNTVYAELAAADGTAAVRAVEAAVQRVGDYVPGYRLISAPLVDGDLITVLLEVEGAGDYLPQYAGNLDIMTSAAVRVAESYARELV
jgi:acetaldehyde dehydrogenase